MVTCSNLKIKAYGKINLALDIVGRRDDGYHMLSTVMQSVSCFDLLDFTLSEGEGIELACDLDSFPKGDDNIITKAYHAFADFTHLDFGCKITVNVEKNLPSQAGMGGGSADAAATLRALDFMFDTRLTDEQLCSIGVSLGADVYYRRHKALSGRWRNNEQPALTRLRFRYNKAQRGYIHSRSFQKV